ncbi:MAG: gamma-glutamylcyclotransferase [Chloroflexi bacterium]|nr:gamma-glutamylcyclotransferase [Chloroflexota bacterium]
MVLVFQYGSNCNQERLNSANRLNDAARLVDKAQTTDYFEIAFDVWSKTNRCAAADLVISEDQKAWGVLYDIPDDRIGGSKRKNGLKTLADIEGPRYERRQIDVTIDGEVKSAVTFLVKKACRESGLATSAKYVCHIIKGLRAFDVPKDYVQRVIDTAIENVESAAVAEKAALERLRYPS